MTKVSRASAQYGTAGWMSAAVRDSSDGSTGGKGALCRRFRHRRTPTLVFGGATALGGARSTRRVEMPFAANAASINPNEDCFLAVAKSVVEDILGRYGMLPPMVEEEDDTLRRWASLRRAA
jgi:hypothetical protein